MYQFLNSDRTLWVHATEHVLPVTVSPFLSYVLHCNMFHMLDHLRVLHCNKADVWELLQVLVSGLARERAGSRLQGIMNVAATVASINQLLRFHFCLT